MAFYKVDNAVVAISSIIGINLAPIEITPITKAISSILCYLFESMQHVD